MTNCTFNGNAANSGGGAMYNHTSSPTVTNCTFSGNTGYAFGGGMVNYFESDPMVSNCTFSGNTTGAAGGTGAGMYNDVSSPTVTNSTFSGNTAGGGGGGMLNTDGGSPTVTNCTFSGNSASFGGGMDNGQSNPTVTHCTFSGNSAAFWGGGMANTQNGPRIKNCILWGNSDFSGMGQSAQIYVSVAAPSVNYTIVQGSTGTLGGTANNGYDPGFVDLDGPDDTVGTLDDDLRLMPFSRAIDAADTTALPPDVADLDDDGDITERTPLDLSGNPRVLDDPATPDSGVPGSGVVDMGAYEFVPDCNANGLPDACDVDCLAGKGYNVPGCGQSPDSDGNGIPDDCETGACCDGASGFCADHVPMAQCAGGQHRWNVNGLCADLDPACTEHTGACCDLLTGTCTNNVLPGACSGAQQSWTKDATCIQAGCQAVTGACCGLNPFGQCVDGLTRAECECEGCEWTKLGSCADVTCTVDSVPTVNAWGLAILSLLLLTGAKLRFSRQRHGRTPLEA